MANILIIDDDDSVLALLQSFFEGLGHKAFKAADGYSAVPVFNSCKPALIVVDYQMPAASGVQVLQRIRGLSGGQNVPAIFLTARPKTELPSDVIDNPLVRFLQKPVALDSLRETVEALLGSPGSAAAAAAPAA